MDKILEMRDKRAKLWNDAKAFLDSHTDGDGKLSAEDAAAYEKMEADVVEMKKAIDRLERQAAIDDSQILLTATQRGDKPIIYCEMLHKGMLGIPLESTAWEGKTYTRFADRFVCDDRNLVDTYLKDGKYTDGLPPVEDQLILGDIINGVVPGRVSEEEFVITSSHGIALSDVAVGQMILKKAEEQGVGVMLPLMEEADILR